MAFTDSTAIKAISAEWLRQKAAGAPQSTLDMLHAQAQALRAQAGYTADASGTIFTALKAAGDTLTGTGAKEVVEAAAQEAAAETVYVFSDGSGYDPTAYATSSKIDGENIAGYIVFGIVGLVLLDKLLS